MKSLLKYIIITFIVILLTILIILHFYSIIKPSHYKENKLLHFKNNN